jgi:hypothetical protein
MESLETDLKASWRLDKEKSFARFSYAEVLTDGRKWYRWQAELTVRPFPNPFGFGSMWPSGNCDSREELEKKKQEFLESVNVFVPHGLKQINIQE